MTLPIAVMMNLHNVTVFTTWNSWRGHPPHLEPKIRTPGHFGLRDNEQRVTPRPQVKHWQWYKNNHGLLHEPRTRFASMVRVENRNMKHIGRKNATISLRQVFDIIGDKRSVCKLHVKSTIWPYRVDSGHIFLWTLLFLLFFVRAVLLHRLPAGKVNGSAGNLYPWLYPRDLPHLDPLLTIMTLAILQ